MKPVNKQFWLVIFGFFSWYLAGGVLFGAILTKNIFLITVFLYFAIPFLIIAPISRFNVTLYLINITYLFFSIFACLISTMIFTLLPHSNATYYYGLTPPENYIACAFCTLPFIALFIYMIFKGCKPVDEIADIYLNKQEKINLTAKEYYSNQKINIFRDIQKNSLYDFRLERFLKRHADIVYRVIMLTAGLGPAIPILISRNAGQQALNYFFLTGISYFTLLCAYFLPIVIQMTRTVLYIQKKYNIKLKLAYKDDVIVVV